MGKVVVGGHHQPAGLPIESMNDPGSQDSADRSPPIEMGLQQICNGLALMLSGWMSDQACRFVDDRNPLIFKDYGNLSSHRPEQLIRRLEQSNTHILARPDPLCHFGGSFVDPDAPGLYQPVEPPGVVVPQVAGEESVDPHALQACLDSEFADKGEHGETVENGGIGNAQAASARV